MAIRIDTNIPYGNACDVSIEECDKITEVSFAADPHGGPECLWFCFRLTQTAQIAETNQKVKLILKHSYNMLGGGAPINMRPVIRRGEADWIRLGAPVIDELPDGRVLVTWIIDAPKTFVDVAYCYPYGLSEVQECW